jgi:hypothetical protein
MTAEILSMLSVRAVALTPKSDQAGKEVVLKVFWATTDHWDDTYIESYHEEVPLIAEQLMGAQYKDEAGNVKSNKFTCEDFAIRVLVEFARKYGLPVKLTTGVRTYKNMENYSPSQHDDYTSDQYGFAEMVMLTYGAREMQKTGVNTVPVGTAEDLKPGDILAQAGDTEKKIAHHIQMAVDVDKERIDIRQGNADLPIVRPFTWIVSGLGMNMANPQSVAYAGVRVQKGYFVKDGESWTYHNPVTAVEKKDFLAVFELYRWNFMGFNKE